VHGVVFLWRKKHASPEIITISFDTTSLSTILYSFIQAKNLSSSLSSYSPFSSTSCSIKLLKETNPWEREEEGEPAKSHH
jgi:hypothetical protein